MAASGNDLEYKIVVLGAGSVGKSALTIRLVTDNFLTDYDPTIEDSYRKLVSIDGEAAQLDILDTAGQDDFVTMQDQWMRDGKGFLLVYSITSRSTFEQVATLRDKILRTKNSNSVPIVLAGNKCDLENDRVVSTAEGKAFADKCGMPFFETSAKKKVNHEECFFAVVREIRKTGPKPPTKPKKDSGIFSLCTIL